MSRIIIGISVGFFVWFIVWLLGIAIIWAMQESDYESVRAISFNDSILLAPLFLNLVASITAGFVTALIARENTKSTLILGAMLSVIGIVLSMSVWDRISLWYHLALLIPLIPITFLGGKLKKI